MTAPGWWYKLPDDAGMVCAPPKCGLISLKVALTPGAPKRLRRNPNASISKTCNRWLREHGVGYYTDEEVMEQFPDLPRFIAIRDPKTRFRSLWHDKCKARNDRDLAGLTPDELMNRIEAYPFGNHHWMPQYTFLLPNTTMVRYDKLHETLGLPEVHTHQAEHELLTWRDLPIDRIEWHYIHDTHLWRRLQL